MRKKIEGVNVEISEELYKGLRDLGVDVESEVATAIKERRENGKRRIDKGVGPKTNSKTRH
jgi:post-segregation antitoxin (ccd killing protein)